MIIHLLSPLGKEFDNFADAVVHSYAEMNIPIASNRGKCVYGEVNNDGKQVFRTGFEFSPDPDPLKVFDEILSILDSIEPFPKHFIAIADGGTDRRIRVSPMPGKFYATAIHLLNHGIEFTYSLTTACFYVFTNDTALEAVLAEIEVAPEGEEHPVCEVPISGIESITYQNFTT